MHTIGSVLCVLAFLLYSIGPGITGNSDLPRVPLQMDAEKRFIVGIAYYFRGVPANSPGLNIPALMPAADEVVIRLYDYNGPEVREDVPTVGDLRVVSELVPQIVEIRRFIPDVPDTLLPLIRVIWDADRDGIADYVAVTEVRDGQAGFRIYAFQPGSKPRMATLWYFSDREIPKLVQL